MALMYSAPQSLSCARVMAVQSLMPFRSASSASIALLFNARKDTRFPCVNNHSFSSHSNKSKSKSLACARAPHSDVPVVTGDTWDEYVLNSDIPVLVEFWAAWCGPCRMVHREIEEIAREYTGRVKFYMLKADENIKIADKYDIKVVPVVVLFKNGEKCDFVTGTMPNYVYTKAIEKLLSS